MKHPKKKQNLLRIVPLNRGEGMLFYLHFQGYVTYFVHKVDIRCIGQNLVKPLSN